MLQGSDYSEDILRNGSGNQFNTKDDKVYHYMRYDVNPFNTAANIAYLERIKRDNPSLADTEVYGLPGSASGMVFAGIMDKIQSNFGRPGLRCLCCWGRCWSCF